MFSNADEVLKYLKDNDVKSVDVRFCDLPGVMQHFTVPVESFGADVFTNGLAFDGSSIRGLQALPEPDMRLRPAPPSARLDPFRTEKTLNMNFFIHDPLTGEAYSRDPRNVAKKAEAYLRGSGLADTAYFGAEAEFYVFDDARFESGSSSSYYYIDAEAAAWNTGRAEEGGNRGYKPRVKGGYFPVFPNTTVNSYRRLVPGYEAPVNLVYSQRNRSACIRIPITGSNPKAKRIEFRCPDPSSNPYLAFSAMLMAGIDGVKNKIEPLAPVDKDLYELPPDEHASIPQVPSSLTEVLTSLEADQDYLLEGGVFTPDLIETWISYKREREVDPVRIRPTPHEFELYFDI